jgi:hypothetical protein
MVRTTALVLALAALAGCASSGGIARMDDGTFTTTSSAILSMGGAGTASAKALKEAAAFCAKEGKRPVTVDQRTDAQITGATVTVRFRCE